MWVYGLRIAAAIALAWLSWHFEVLLPLLLLFGYVVFSCSRWHETWLACAAYYLTVSYEIPTAFHTYFPDLNPALGYLTWLSAGFLIAAPWALAKAVMVKLDLDTDRWRVLAVLALLVVTALPPFGWITWTHPLLLAGILFPGLGLSAILLTAVAIACTPLLARLSRVGVTVTVVLFFGMVIVANQLTVPAPAYSAVDAMRTQNGMYFYSQGMKRMSAVGERIREAVDLEANDWIILTPESYLGPHRSSIDLYFQQFEPAMQQHNLTTLVGMDVEVRPGVFLNALTAYGAEQGVVYSARLPMILNALPMGKAREALQPWRSPVVPIGRHGKRVFFAICYEGYLIEHLMAALLSGDPIDEMIVASNLWAIHDLWLARIQAGSIQLMARIVNAPLAWSYNL
jgi:hypothetical protein